MLDEQTKPQRRNSYDLLTQEIYVQENLHKYGTFPYKHGYVQDRHTNYLSSTDSHAATVSILI